MGNWDCKEISEALVEDDEVHGENQEDENRNESEEFDSQFDKLLSARLRGEGSREDSPSSSCSPCSCSKIGEEPLGFGKEESSDWSPRAFRGEDPSACLGIEAKARPSMASGWENGGDPSRVSAIEAGEDELLSWVFGRGESEGK